MTVEEKAKAYDEAIEELRGLLEGIHEEKCEIMEEDITDIFPELKESEDERIRKELYDFCIKCSYGETLVNQRVDFQRWAAWLEKQDIFSKKDVDDAYLKGVRDTKNEIEKQYEANYQIRKDIATFIFNYRGDIKDRAKWIDYLGIKVSFVEMQGKQKSADKVEPKFHEGEWITNGDYTWKIVEVKPLDYILQSQDGNVVDDTISHVDEQFHSFTIEDAKYGDVLFYDSICGFTFIYNGINPEGALLFSYIESNDGSPLLKYNIGKPNVGIGYATDKNIYPATKEQRVTLFAKMREAGYEWDAEHKQLNKIEQKSAEDSCKNSDDITTEEKDMTEYKKGFERGKQRVLKYPEDFDLCKKTLTAWSEEDERTYKSVLYAFEHNYPLISEQQKFIKSLKDKVQQRSLE